MTTIFVGYPYRIDGYREALRSGFPTAEVEFTFADERLVDDHVLRKTERMIDESDLALFDVTHANPNVTLELGIAIAKKHPYIVVIDKSSLNELNADIHGWDQLRYSTLSELVTQLKVHLDRGSLPLRAHPRIADTSSDVNRGLQDNSPIPDQHYPVITLQPQAMNPDSILGCRVVPKKYRSAARAFDESDDEMMKSVEVETCGQSGGLHTHLILQPKPSVVTQKFADKRTQYVRG
jgi:hypothetical protein